MTNPELLWMAISKMLNHAASIAPAAKQVNQ
jgi:hypothetical protein